MEQEQPKSARGGRRPGAGTRTAEERAQLANVMAKAFPASKREAVMRSLVKAAIAGNVKAATLLFNYAYGRPKEFLEVSSAPGRPVRFVMELESDADEPV